MVPWLWACSNMHGCLSLRANSTLTVKFPRTRPPSDTATKESANTHLCSSAGSEEEGFHIQSTLTTFVMFSFERMLFTESPWQFAATRMCQNQVTPTLDWLQLHSIKYSHSPMLDMNKTASSEAFISSLMTASSASSFSGSSMVKIALIRLQTRASRICVRALGEALWN